MDEVMRYLKMNESPIVTRESGASSTQRSGNDYLQKCRAVPRRARM